MEPIKPVDVRIIGEVVGVPLLACILLALVS